MLPVTQRSLPRQELGLKGLENVDLMLSSFPTCSFKRRPRKCRTTEPGKTGPRARKGSQREADINPCLRGNLDHGSYHDRCVTTKVQMHGSPCRLSISPPTNTEPHHRLGDALYPNAIAHKPSSRKPLALHLETLTPSS